jgi:thioester reductase-like protein
MAEELLFREKSEGLCVSIYRVGNVVFDSNSGSFQQNISENGFYLMLKSLIQLECIPEIRTKTLDFSFVDFVSKAIVLLFDKEKIQNEVFHITNPNRISLVEFSDYLHEAEIELRVMEAQPFIKMLDEQISDTRTGVDYANLLLHSNILNSQPGRNIILSSDKTDFILNALGFSWRRIEKEDVKKMIEYCRAVNFLR